MTIKNGRTSDIAIRTFIWNIQTTKTDLRCRTGSSAGVAPFDVAKHQITLHYTAFTASINLFLRLLKHLYKSYIYQQYLPCRYVINWPASIILERESYRTIRRIKAVAQISSTLHEWIDPWINFLLLLERSKCHWNAFLQLECSIQNKMDTNIENIIILYYYINLYSSTCDSK